MKYYTIFISSNDKKDSVKQWCVSATQVRTTFIGLISLGVLLLGFSIDYILVFSSQKSTKKHLEENKILKTRIVKMQSQVEQLFFRLNQIEDFSTQLKYLAGLEETAGGAFSVKAMGPLPGPLPLSDGLTFYDTQKKANPALASTAYLEGTSAPSIDSLMVYVDKLDKKSQLVRQNVYALLPQLHQKQDIVRSTPSIIPVRGWISSQFGYRQYPFNGEVALHEGIDIAALPGTPVYAPADGEVVFAGYRIGYGKLIIIDHGYGLSTLYGHLSDVSMVSVQQKIKRKEVIGVTGNTGHSSGPHLHYEVRLDGVPVDPINYIINEI